MQPVALVGTRDCFPAGALWPRRARVEVRFGRLIHIRSRRPDGRRVENQEASDAIMLAVAEQLPEGMRGAYADLEALRQRLDGVWEPAPGAAGRAASAVGRGDHVKIDPPVLRWSQMNAAIDKEMTDLWDGKRGAKEIAAAMCQGIEPYLAEQRH